MVRRPSSSSKAIGVGLTGLALFAASGHGASDPLPRQAVEQLNAWRGIVGVGPVTHDAALDAGCRRHADYYRVNPTHLGHREEPGADGYTAAGDRAARSSVLSFGDALGTGIRAWEPGPYHRIALLDPRLTSTGFWSEFGLSCMAVTRVTDELRTPAATAYTYPVHGQRGVPVAFWCAEIPNPCEAVPGNDGNSPTGFNVTVQFNGPWLAQQSVAVTTASLTPAGGGPVPLTVQTRDEILRGGIVLIPHEPLALGTTYVATAQGTIRAIADDGVSTSHPFAVRWDFSTPGTEPPASLRVSVQRVTRNRIQLQVNLLSDAPRRARISLLDGRSDIVRVVRRLEAGSQQVTIRRPRRKTTMIGVLLRGSATHAGVAARLPVHISARGSG